MATICVLGASTSWVPGLVTDLMSVFEEPLDIRLIDLNPRAGELGVEWCEAANRHHGRRDRFRAFTDRREALAGADAVLITLAVGGLAAMEQDLSIAEKYRVYTTVGDTAGPAGWARAIRNIPTFEAFAADFQEVCPSAIIVNYSNPMAALSATLTLAGDRDGRVADGHDAHQQQRERVDEAQRDGAVEAEQVAPPEPAELLEQRVGAHDRGHVLGERRVHDGQDRAPHEQAQGAREHPHAVRGERPPEQRPVHRRPCPAVSPGLPAPAPVSS